MHMLKQGDIWELFRSVYRPTLRIEDNIGHANRVENRQIDEDPEAVAIG